MYYLMDWRVNEAELGLNLADIDVIPYTGVPWTMGIYRSKPVNQPINLIIDSESGTDIPDAFLVGIPLFSDRLLDLLSTAGIDNIQAYDAVITDPRNGHVFNNYKAVNIVGLVSCANLEKSTYFEGSEPPLMHFEHLVIDENKTHGFHFFRLAESASVILIEEKIAEKIIESKMVGIRVIPIDSN